MKLGINILYPELDARQFHLNACRTPFIDHAHPSATESTESERYFPADGHFPTNQQFIAAHRRIAGHNRTVARKRA